MFCLFSSSFGSCVVQLLVGLMLSHEFLNLHSFSLFPCCCSHWTSLLPCLRVHWLFLLCNLLLNPSIVFFSAVRVFFNSVTSVWCLLMFSVSLFNCHFVHAFFFCPQWAFLWSLFWTMYQVNHLSLFHWDLFLRFYLFWGRGIYSSVSSFSLPLYVGFYALDKTNTSPSLGDEPHPSSPSQLSVVSQTFVFGQEACFILSSWRCAKMCYGPKGRVLVSSWIRKPNPQAAAFKRCKYVSFRGVGRFCLLSLWWALGW